MSLKIKSRTGLPGIIAFAAGILGFVLFRWTPRSGKGILWFAGLFVLLVALIAFLNASGKEDEAAD
jgi:TctA family transporter